MHQLSVIRFVTKHGMADCGIASLAMYLGTSYENVLTVAATELKNSRIHLSGLYATDLMRVSKRMGIPLKQQRQQTWDLDGAFGLLVLDFPTNRHVVLLKEGLIYDPEDLTIWEYESYFDAGDGCIPMMVLTEKC